LEKSDAMLDQFENFKLINIYRQNKQLSSSLDHLVVEHCALDGSFLSTKLDFLWLGVLFCKRLLRSLEIDMYGVSRSREREREREREIVEYINLP
jgi:hypothetical protein